MYKRNRNQLKQIILTASSYKQSKQKEKYTVCFNKTLYKQNKEKKIQFILLQ